MKKLSSIFLTFILGIMVMLSGFACEKKETTLKDAYEDYFPIGAAIPFSMLKNYDDIIGEFSSLTAENEMKWGYLQPQRGVYTFDQADAIVTKAQENDMLVRGHALVWHSSAPNYIFKKTDGTDTTKEQILSDINAHINEVVKHFGDKIYCWDVVNEVISDGSEQYRDSDFYKRTGTDYIFEAFKTARKANPDIKLFYNDYEMINPVKRAKTIDMIRTMQENDIPIDGIGMQAHYNIYNFNFVEFEQAILDFKELGLEIQITELDFSIYAKDSDTQVEMLTDEIQALQARCYEKAFEIMRRHSDVITGVTLWGLADDHTWLDDFPVRNRKNYPLLFSVSHKAKPAYNAIKDF